MGIDVFYVKIFGYIDNTEYIHYIDIIISIAYTCIIYFYYTIYYILFKLYLAKYSKQYIFEKIKYLYICLVYTFLPLRCIYTL